MAGMTEYAESAAKRFLGGQIREASCSAHLKQYVATSGETKAPLSRSGPSDMQYMTFLIVRAASDLLETSPSKKHTQLSEDSHYFYLFLFFFFCVDAKMIRSASSMPYFGSCIAAFKVEYYGKIKEYTYF